MSGNSSKDSIKILNKIAEETGNIFIDEYIIVPDSKSGIKKILLFDVFSAIDSSEIVNSRINVTGMLRYNIVYISDDNFDSMKILSGNLNFANLMDYNIHLTSENRVETWCKVDRLEHSLVNSRKISLNAVLKASHLFFRIDTKKYVVDVPNFEDAQMLKGEKDILDFHSFKEELFSIVGSFEIPFDKPEIDNVALANILSYETDFAKKEYEIEMNCKIKARFAYISTQSDLCFEEFEFSTDEIINVEDMPSDSKYFYRSYLKDIITDICEDGDGERRIVKFQVKLGVIVEIYQSKRIEFIQDLYYMDMESTLKNTEIMVIESSHAIDKRFKIQTVFEEVGSYEEIYICSSDLNCNVSSNQYDELSIMGNVKLKGILFSSQNQQDTKEITLNLQFEERMLTDNYTLNGDGNVRLNLVIDDVMVSDLGRERLECEVVVIARMEMFLYDKIEIMEEVELGARIINPMSEHTSFKLYYTSAKDSLWNISKKYRIRKDELKSINEDVDFDNLMPGVMLLLP
jgi:hypothetical protein